MSSAISIWRIGVARLRMLMAARWIFRVSRINGIGMNSVKEIERLVDVGNGEMEPRVPASAEGSRGL